MSLTNEGTGTTMLVQPTGFGGYGNSGFGFGGDGSWAWIILLLLAFGGGWGMGGFGGFGGMDGLYPWLNNSQNINGGFRDQFINTQIGDLRTDVNRGFGDVQLGLAGVNQNVCQTGNSIVNALNNGFSGAEISANNRQMANMQQMFGLQSSLQNCCCENRAGIADVKYTIATENCADRAAISDGVRDILAATQAQNQRILDQLCADKIEQKNDTIAQLRSELLYARGQASQDVQTAAIQAGQRALANEVEQYVLPTPRPAYVVANPNCCQPYNCGCGCGVA